MKLLTSGLGIAALAGVLATSAPGRLTGQLAEPGEEEVRTAYRDLYDAMLVYGWQRQSAFCNPDEGETCVYDADFQCGPDRRGCPPIEVIDGLLADVLAALERHPEVLWGRIQAAMRARSLERPQVGRALAEGCPGSGWECPLIDGWWKYGAGRHEEAAEAYARALETMPREEWEIWSDLSPLGVEREGYPPASRDAWEAVNDTIWWLADPFWSVPGNGRRLGHLDRVAYQALDQVRGVGHDRFERDDTGALRLLAAEHPHTGRRWIRTRIRTGPIDAWNVADRPMGEFWGRDAHYARALGYEYNNFWVSRSGSRYSFLPRMAVLDDPFSATAGGWELEQDDPEERFTDPEWRTIVPLSAQIGVFLRDGAWVVVAASELPHDLAPAGSAHRGALVLTEGPGRFELAEDSTPSDDVYRLRDTVPPGRYLVGVEVLVPGSEAAGRIREGLGAGPLVDGPALSGILLTGGGEGDPPQAPGTLDEAASRALGRTWIRSGEEVQAYWELYGVERGEAVRHELRIRREKRGGVLGTIAGWIGLGRGGSEVAVGWEEPAEPEGDGVIRQGLALDLGRLEPGAYLLEIRAEVDAGAEEPLSARRRFEISGR